MPYRLVALPCRSRDHTTSGLAFLAFQSHKNRRKRYHGNVPGRGTWALAGQVGPRTEGHGVARVDSDHAECLLLSPKDILLRTLVTHNYCCHAHEVTLSFMDTLIALTYLLTCSRV